MDCQKKLMDKLYVEQLIELLLLAWIYYFCIVYKLIFSLTSALDGA